MTSHRHRAILAADVVGFSSLMEDEEETTFERVRTVRRDVIQPQIEHHGGRLVKNTGDGFLLEFSSALEALRCALSIQQGIAVHERDSHKPVTLRIGINLCHVMVEEDGDVYGDGVNVAARLESLAEQGGILVSGKVFDEVKGQIDCDFESRGEHTLKNMSRSVRIYAVRLMWR